MKPKPFSLIEEKMSKDWTPEIGKEYLIEYKFNTDKEPNFLIGKFHKQWYGFTFDWFWGAASLQLSNQDYSDDWKYFKRVWQFVRGEEFISEDDFLEIENGVVA